MGNCLFLRARGWGIDRQVRKKLQIPGGVPGGGMVTGRIEPCISLFKIPDTKQVREFPNKLFIRMSPLLFMKLLLGCSILKLEGKVFYCEQYFIIV